eukprot:16190056-Heterocapsa_arctica.AAC.1
MLVQSHDRKDGPRKAHMSRFESSRRVIAFIDEEVAFVRAAHSQSAPSSTRSNILQGPIGEAYTRSGAA